MKVKKFVVALRRGVLRLFRGRYRVPVACVAAVAITFLLVKCSGYTTPPTNITASSATLNAIVSCSANTSTNPCTFWFQYWTDVKKTDGTVSILRTSPFTFNIAVNNFPVSQTVSGLSAGTLYHYQLCGYGDNNIGKPGICDSPLFGGNLDTANRPGTLPDVGDLNATATFRTATSSTKATIDLGRVLSTADTGIDPISRDGGFSVVYSTNPLKSLWLFGDTAQKTRDPNNPYVFLGGTTAAAGPVTVGQAPTALNELPTPPAAPVSGLTSPALFFPTPVGLQVPGSAIICASENSNTYAAAWASGGAKEPNSSKLVLVYAEMCVGGANGWAVERLTLTEYDPMTNKFIAFYTPFVASPLNTNLPDREVLNNPVFGNDGYLYLFGSTASANAVYVARVSASPSAWGNKANYRWWSNPAGLSGTGTWASESAATSIISGVMPFWLNVGDYSGSTISHKYVLIVQTGLGPATFTAFEATSPKGPWRAGPAGQLPDTCNYGMFGCYAIIGHPELSNQQQLVFSWYSTDDLDNFAHVRLGSINW